MRLYLLFAFVTIAGTLSCATAPSLAQDSNQRNWFHDIAYKSTLVMGHVDLEAIDIEKCQQVMNGKLAPQLKQQADFAMTMVEATLTQLKNAGANEIICTISADNILTECMVVVTCRDTQAVVNLLQVAVSQIPADFGYSAHEADGAVVLCGERSWQRIVEERSRPLGHEKEDSSRWSGLAEPDAKQHWMAVSLPTQLRNEVALLWPKEIAFGKVTLSPSSLAADILAARCDLVADQNVVAELSLACVDEAATDRTLVQVNEWVGMMPANLDGVAVPKVTVQRAGKIITVSCLCDDFGSVVSAVLNNM